VAFIATARVVTESAIPASYSNSAWKLTTVTCLYGSCRPISQTALPENAK
jgi:hypothetical protein